MRRGGGGRRRRQNAHDTGVATKPLPADIPAAVAAAMYNPAY